MIDFEAPQREADTIEQLLQTLRDLPDSDAHVLDMVSGRIGREIDAEIDFSVAGKSIVLLVEVKKSVYPRDVHQVLWQLNRYTPNFGSEHRKNIVPLLAADSISPGARDVLKNEGCGFFDRGGSLYIPARGAYVYIEKPPARSHQKIVGGLFKGKRAQVLHALLMNPGAWFGVKELADLAHVSPAMTSETLTAVERFDWLVIRGKGPSKERRLKSPEAMLDEWSKRVRETSKAPKYRRFYVPRKKPEELAQQLTEACDALKLDCVLTQEAAAQRYAPFLTSISRTVCRLKPGRAVDELYAALEARPVTEGANLDVLETTTESEFLFKVRLDGVWLASPVQVYLDLLQGGGRGQEMAEHLRAERIGY
jgi:hypothetical protein